MMYLFKAVSASIAALAQGVSILVLMDVPLQGPQGAVGLYTAGSFNPCFNGCTSSSNASLNLLFMPYNVSILVLMDVPLQE